jgi:hypothetical protein
MASGYYNSFYENLLSGVFDMSASTSDTYKVALATSAYVFDENAIDTHEFFSDVVATEATGTAYLAGGVALTSLSLANSSIVNRTTVYAEDAEWASSTITARGAWLYKDTGVPTESPLIRYIDFGTDQSTANTLFKITWSEAGIADLTQA